MPFGRRLAATRSRSPRARGLEISLEAPGGGRGAISVSRLASFGSRQWIAGMALFGTIATIKSQAPRTQAFLAAYAYLDEVFRVGSPAQARLLALTEGQSKRVELTDGVYAMEQVYATKPRAEGVFESHRKYIDLQVLLEGEEILEVIDLARVTVSQAYDAERDYALYADHPEGSRLRLKAGEAAIFYPVDVHMPSVRFADQAVRVRKTVVKIPVG